MVTRAGERRDLDRPMSDVLDGLQRTGPELMALQIEIMTRMHEAQVRQRELLEAIHAAQERWIASVERAPDDHARGVGAREPNAQVSMRAMGVMMLKVVFAAMPAVLLVGLVELALMAGLIAILANFGVFGRV